MDYNLLLDNAVELGYRLAMNGAETYRIEESIQRTLGAYGVHAEVFAIPNCLHVSMETPEGTPLTRMRRIGHHGNNMDTMETYSNISRKVCQEVPELSQWSKWLEEAKTNARSYPLWLQILGGFLVGSGYNVLFYGGYWTDLLLSGICGSLICLVNALLERLKVNPFFVTICSAFAAGLAAYTAASLSLTVYTDAVVIGALMILVPGLLFTNALRDIIFGDTNSGINRVVQVFLIAAAIGLGTGAAWQLCTWIGGPLPGCNHTVNPIWADVVACFIGCLGLLFLFNIHGKGGILCALGGALTWFTYRMVFAYTHNSYFANLSAILVAAVYAEIMARIRKYPATAYLVISVFPLLPGAGIYHTMMGVLNGNVTMALKHGGDTLAIAGILAVGILMVSTVFRFLAMIKRKA